MSRPDGGKRETITPQILLKAYSVGLFPMAESADDPDIFWVEPKMRGVIPLDQFHVPRSLARVIKRGVFDIRRNTAFAEVVDECAREAEGRESTWINKTIKRLYGKLHWMGHAHSVEAWFDDVLVGGLYGVSLGGAFFGESMFSRKTDASKACLVHLVSHLRDSGFVLLDTQFTTPHLERFGAIEVPKQDYEKLLDNALTKEASF